MTPSTAGAPAVVGISTLPEYRDSIRVIIDGRTVTLPKFAEVNGELKSGYYEIQDGDSVIMRDFYTIRQILDFLDVMVDNREEIYVNHEQASMDTPVYDNFTVSLSFADQDSGRADKDSGTESPEEPFDDAEDDEADINDQEDLGSDKGDAGGTSKDKAESAGTVVKVLVNGKNVVLSGKKDYIYVDVFDLIHFDLP